MKGFDRIVTWAMTIAGLVALAAPAAAVPAATRLAAVIETDAAVFGPADPVKVRFELRNDGGNDALVLVWRTPFAGFDADVLDVRRDGQPVQYIGRLVHWGEPTDADYVRLAAGESRAIDLDISAAYDLSAAGTYTVRYRGEALGPQAVRVLDKAAGARVAIDAPTAGFELVGDFTPRAAAAEPTEKALAPGYVACTNTQQGALSTALGNAEAASLESYGHLTSSSVVDSTDSRFITWFGTYDASRYSTVTSHFASIYNAFSTKAVTFHCDCTSTAYAYVYPTQPYNIWLCNAFWNAPAKGTDSKAGTLVHEMSHFNATAGTGDLAYGQTACKKLALKKPRSAINNADSHEYFAEAGM